MTRTLTRRPTDRHAEPEATEATTARRRPRAPRRLLVMLAVVFAMIGFATPAFAAYSYYASDSYGFYCPNYAVAASGRVDRYQDPRTWYQPAIFRGQHANGSAVWLRSTGCLYVEVDWKTATGAASWPPSGTSSTTSDGWYRKCGVAGTTLYLSGQAYASSTLYKTCLSVGYSRSAAYPRTYQSTGCADNCG